MVRPAGEAGPGAVLFNNRYLVTVVGAIASHDQKAFTTRQLAHACGISDSLVRPVLNRLLAAGLLRERERRGGARGELLFQVFPQLRWDRLVALCAALDDPGSPASAG